tara:strand:- start:101 stop:658 length:558 start_codon:yes stop_codon:yes gene_type:complete
MVEVNKGGEWTALQEDVITFVNEREGSAFPRPSDSNVAVLAGVFNSGYKNEEGTLLSSKLALRELLESYEVETTLILNINSDKNEWHYVLTMDKSGSITPTTTVAPAIPKVEEKVEEAVDFEEVAMLESEDKVELTHEGISGMKNADVIAYVLQHTGEKIPARTKRGQLIKMADDILDKARDSKK